MFIFPEVVRFYFVLPPFHARGRFFGHLSGTVDRVTVDDVLEPSLLIVDIALPGT